MFDIRKYLPGYIEVRSIYWQEKMVQVQEDINQIHDLIVEFFYMDDAHNAMKLRTKIEWLIKLFERKYINNGLKYPKYIKQTIADIHLMKRIMDIK